MSSQTKSPCSAGKYCRATIRAGSHRRFRVFMLFLRRSKAIFPSFCRYGVGVSATCDVKPKVLRFSSTRPLKHDDWKHGGRHRRPQLLRVYHRLEDLIQHSKGVGVDPGCHQLLLCSQSVSIPEESLPYLHLPYLHS